MNELLPGSEVITELDYWSGVKLQSFPNPPRLTEFFKAVWVTLRRGVILLLQFRRLLSLTFMSGPWMEKRSSSRWQPAFWERLHGEDELWAQLVKSIWSRWRIGAVHYREDEELSPITSLISLWSSSLFWLNWILQEKCPLAAHLSYPGVGGDQLHEGRVSNIQSIPPSVRWTPPAWAWVWVIPLRTAGLPKCFLHMERLGGMRAAAGSGYILRPAVCLLQHVVRLFFSFFNLFFWGPIF